MASIKQMANFRGIFPGVFTMGNMLCGFLSILAAHNQEYSTAGWLIFLAAFLDGLDGKVARISRASSQFGKELDSLSDIISFGLAPAFLIHTAKLSQFGRVGFMIGAVYLMSGAFRLARYNIGADPHRKDDYTGLPIPIAAILIASYIVFSMEMFGEISYHQWLIGITIAVSGLMVSTIPFHALPEKIDRVEKRWIMLGIFVFLVAVWIKPSLIIFPFVAIYVLIGVIREGYKMLNPNEKDEKGNENEE